MRFLHLLVATLVGPPPRRNQRGLSQSTETALLMGGAVLVAGVVLAAVIAFVNAKVPRP